VSRTREYVEIVRKALAGDKLAYDGREYTLPRPGGLGKSLRLLAQPVQERIPVYLGAVGPKAIEQTGAIADGWLPAFLDPAQPDVLMEPLRAGAERAGRPVSEIDVAAAVPVAIDDDVDAARAAIRPWTAFYLGAMGAKEKNFYVDVAARYGHGDAAREVQDRFTAGDRAGAAQAVTDELLESVGVACTPAQLDDRLAAFERAGVTTLLAVPCGDRERVVRALA
jgi:alkanesulfonate monooxygenase SsuD/methylene tetrahydromethanopterin reductase-like flavin-dependent oxidoreductase (luciferase family)